MEHPANAVRTYCVSYYVALGWVTAPAGLVEKG